MPACTLVSPPGQSWCSGNLWARNAGSGWGQNHTSIHILFSFLYERIKQSKKSNVSFVRYFVKTLLSFLFLFYLIYLMWILTVLFIVLLLNIFEFLSYSIFILSAMPFTSQISEQSMCCSLKMTHWVVAEWPWDQWLVMRTHPQTSIKV